MIPIGTAKPTTHLENVGKAIAANLKPLLKLSTEDLLAQRLDKFDKMGTFTEV